MSHIFRDMRCSNRGNVASALLRVVVFQFPPPEFGFVLLHIRIKPVPFSCLSDADEAMQVQVQHNGRWRIWLTAVLFIPTDFLSLLSAVNMGPNSSNTLVERPLFHFFFSTLHLSILHSNVTVLTRHIASHCT